MAVVVGFVSEKGGVGKTTCCYHVAVGLHRYHDMSVLVIDADYQRGGMTGRFFPELIENFRTGQVPGVTLFHKYQQLYSGQELDPQVDTRQSQYGVDVIVSDPRLASVSVDKLPATNNIRDNNLMLLRHLQVVNTCIAELGDTYDYILIDSHPEVSDVLRSIIYASKYCVSPVKLDLQSSIGVPTVIGEINQVNSDVEMIKQSLVPNLEYASSEFAGAIGMMAREWGGVPKETERAELRRLRRLGGVFERYVTEGDGLRQAAAARVPVYDLSGANASKQAAQFRDLVTEFVGRCHP